MTYNIFDFSEEEPDTFIYDVSSCFTDDQITNVNFKLPGDQAKLIEANRIEFKYWLLVNIIGYLDISPIRITGLEVWQSLLNT